MTVLPRINLKTVALPLAISTLLAGASSQVLAKQDGSIPPGQPFTSLNELIEANAAAIAANSDAVSDNTAAIEGIATRVDGLELQMVNVGARLTANETSIADAFTAIDGVVGDVAELSSSLYDLKLSVTQNIAAINDEISQVKDEILLLAADLSGLTVVVADTTADLQAAMEVNSADINALSASLVVMNSNLTIAQSNITTLQAQVTSAESAIDSQQAQLAVIDGVLENHGERIVFLEENQESPNVNGEFTLIDIYRDEDITDQEFVNKLTSLNYHKGEYLFISANSKNAFGEICTNDPEAFYVLETYISGGNKYYSGPASSSSENWMRHSRITAWRGASSISYRGYASSYYPYLVFSASDSARTSRAIYVNPNRYPNEAYVSGTGVSSSGGDVKVLYKAGSTRQEACGF